MFDEDYVLCKIIALKIINDERLDAIDFKVWEKYKDFIKIIIDNENNRKTHNK